MLEKTSAIDVYFEDEIEILVPDADEFEVDTAKEILAEAKIEYTQIEASSTR